MDRTSKSFFLSIKNEIVDVLVSNQAFHQILDLATFIPSSYCLDGVIFESVLNTEISDADVSFYLASPSERLVSDTNRLKDLAPAWTCISRLFDTWQKHDSLVSKKIRGVWLEFDITGPNPRTPSIFVSLKKELFSQYEIIELLKELQEVIGKFFFPDDTYHCVRSCILELPQGTSVNQIGFMTSRKPSPVRLCFSDLTFEGEKNFRNYLKKVGYKHDTKEWVDCCRELSQYCDRIDLAIDMGQKGLMDRLGLELFQRSANPLKEPHWNQIYDQLVNQNLCSGEYKKSLLHFFRHDCIKAQDNPWLCGLDSGAFEYSYVNTVSHLKLCYTPSKKILPKGYFWLHYQPRPVNVFSEEVFAEIFDNGRFT